MFVSLYSIMQYLLLIFQIILHTNEDDGYLYEADVLHEKKTYICLLFKRKNSMLYNMLEKYISIIY